MEKQEIRIEVSRERVLTRVRMATAYASVRGVGESGEEALNADGEMLDILYDSARASLTATMAGLGLAADGDVWSVTCGPGNDRAGADALRVILEDWLVARVMRGWYRLLRLVAPTEGTAAYKADADDAALITEAVSNLLPKPESDAETLRRRGKRPGARLRLDPW